MYTIQYKVYFKRQVYMQQVYTSIYTYTPTHTYAHEWAYIKSYTCYNYTELYTHLYWQIATKTIYSQIFVLKREKDISENFLTMFFKLYMVNSKYLLYYFIFISKRRILYKFRCFYVLKNIISMQILYIPWILQFCFLEILIYNL